VSFGCKVLPPHPSRGAPRAEREKYEAEHEDIAEGRVSRDNEDLWKLVFLIFTHRRPSLYRKKFRKNSHKQRMSMGVSQVIPLGSGL
jgi:hypothetical protein